MISVESEPWAVMVRHAERTYPEECCGAMIGSVEDGAKLVRAALPLANAFAGLRTTRYEVSAEDLRRADAMAREDGMTLIGIYHSHPDRDARFSETDLKNSCPWFSFVVLSIRNGAFHDAGSWVPDAGQTAAAREELRY
jgi:proteasome lid subunit RPN8/RPN11